MPEPEWKPGDPERRKDAERRKLYADTQRLVEQGISRALEARAKANEEKRKKEREGRGTPAPVKKRLGLLEL